MSRTRIILRCACGNAILAERAKWEPQEAVEVVASSCPVCNPRGDGDYGTLYDREGNEVAPIEELL